jgi:hypothetical protein
LQRQNRNTKLQKLKESRNTRFCRSGRQNITLKKFAETERKYQIAETEEKMKYQNNCRDITEIPSCRSWRKVEIPDFAETEDKILLQKKIVETECKYQIAETKEKTKYQNNCRDRTEIPNCKSWRKVEIPDFAEAEDKISL